MYYSTPTIRVHQYVPGTVPTQNNVEKIATLGRLDILKALGGRVVYNSKVADKAAGGGHLNILEWLASLPAGSGRQPVLPR